MANGEAWNKIVKKYGKKIRLPATAAVLTEGQTESDIQQSCIRWFSFKYPHLAQDGVLFHIPNEGIRLGGMGARIRREGVVRGVADLCLCIPRGGYGALYIEMKKPNRYQSPEQKKWQAAVEKHGNRYVVCKSLTEFIETINGYLNEQDPHPQR